MFYAEITVGNEKQIPVQEVLTICGGVPGAIIEYLQKCRFLPSFKALTNLSLHQYFEVLWRKHSLQAQRLWFLMKLLKTGSVSITLIETMFCLTETELVALGTEHIITFQNRSGQSSYTLTPAAGDFVALNVNPEALELNQFITDLLTCGKQFELY